MLTAVGTVLGAAAFVATLGLTSTVGNQVSAEFDAYRATEVRIEPREELADSDWMSQQAIQRLRRLNGVVHVGRRVRTAEVEAAKTRTVGEEPRRLPLQAMDPEALEVVRPRMVSGRTFDQFHHDNAEPVVLLAESAARRLGINRAGSAVFVRGTGLTVIGIFDDVVRREETLLAAVIPLSVGETLIDSGQPDVLVETVPGAAGMVAGQSPLALRPEDPTGLDVFAPRDPDSFRQGVEADVTRLGFLASLVAFTIGAVSIANAATASMVTRIPEIGLRRAVGARPRHIFMQLLTETSMLGGVGGAAGALIGVSIVNVVSYLNMWAPVLDLRLAVAASASGAVAGVLAGLYPAWKATRIQPVDALQR